MESKLRDFMKEDLMIDFEKGVSKDTDLFKAGLINSFDYIQILNFLENELNITLTEDEILSNVMVSFKNIIDLIERKK